MVCGVLHLKNKSTVTTGHFILKYFANRGEVIIIQSVLSIGKDWVDIQNEWTQKVTQGAKPNFICPDV